MSGPADPVVAAGAVVDPVASVDTEATLDELVSASLEHADTASIDAAASAQAA
jgi:hypothetical protein